MAPHHGGGHCHVHVPVHHHHHHNHHPVRPVIPVTPVRLVQSRPPVPITPVASVNHHHCPPQNAGPPVIYPIFLPLVACSWHRESQNRRDRHVLKRKAYNDVEQAFIEKAKKNAVVIKLTLQKDKKRFGFSIADSYKPGDLFISKIKKNSPAANEGLCYGDQILEINGSSVESFDKALAVKAVAEKDTLVIVISRTRTTQIEVTVEKSKEGFTFQLMGGVENPRFLGKRGIYVSNGLQQSKMELGDELLEIDGRSTTGMSLRKAASLIDKTQSVVILVRRMV